jgi:hypothetical protein
MISSASDMAQKGKNEINKAADKAKDTASSVWTAKEAWNA